MAVVSVATSKLAMASLAHRGGVRVRAGSQGAKVSGGARRRVPLSGPAVSAVANAVAPVYTRRQQWSSTKSGALGGDFGVSSLVCTGRSASSSSSSSSSRVTMRAGADASAAGAGGAGGASVSTVAATTTSSSGDDSGGKASKKPVALLAGVAVVVGAVGWLVTHNTAVGQATMAALAKSGFTAAFALIFVSELGDKTFFIAALLAMRLGRRVVLAGATSALGLMSVISVAIGKIFQQIPNTITTTLPIGEYLAVALLMFFGVRTLKEALDTPEPDGEEESGELADAEEAVSQSEVSRGKIEGVLAAFWQTFSLVFIAEWGDRSMLATIALGAAQNPFGVASGATVGHLLATLIAVVGGRLLSKRISERQVGITGGVLFIIFAFATLAGVF